LVEVLLPKVKKYQRRKSTNGTFWTTKPERKLLKGKKCQKSKKSGSKKVPTALLSRHHERKLLKGKNAKKSKMPQDKKCQSNIFKPPSRKEMLKGKKTKSKKSCQSKKDEIVFSPPKQIEVYTKRHTTTP